MTNRMDTFGLFIDYDNLSNIQKSSRVLDIVTSALLLLPFFECSQRARCEIRVYGGWYEGSQITRLAQDLAVQLQADFPAIVRRQTLSGSEVFIDVNAELAVALMEEPGHHLLDTYRRKGKPRNVRVATPTSVGCSDSACQLNMLARLLRTGQCPIPTCTNAHSDLVYRHEQKIVDTMLSCDLIHSETLGHRNVILVSSDDDFLPPLRTLLLRGVQAVRFHTQISGRRVNFPAGPLQLIEMDL